MKLIEVILWKILKKSRCSLTNRAKEKTHRNGGLSVGVVNLQSSSP